MCAELTRSFRPWPRPQAIAAGAGAASIPFLLGALGGGKAAPSPPKHHHQRGDRSGAAAAAGGGRQQAAAAEQQGKADEQAAAAAAAPLPLAPGQVRLREAVVPAVLTMALVASVVRSPLPSITRRSMRTIRGRDMTAHCRWRPAPLRHSCCWLRRRCGG